MSTFIAGAVVGAGLALLFAPQAGAQLRGLLCDYATRTKDKLHEAVDQGTEMLDSAVEHIGKGKDALRETGRQAKEAAEAVSPSVSKTPDGEGARAPALRWADFVPSTRNTVRFLNLRVVLSGGIQDSLKGDANAFKSRWGF